MGLGRLIDVPLDPVVEFVQRGLPRLGQERLRLLAPLAERPLLLARQRGHLQTRIVSHEIRLWDLGRERLDLGTAGDFDHLRVLARQKGGQVARIEGDLLGDIAQVIDRPGGGEDLSRKRYRPILRYVTKT